MVIVIHNITANTNLMVTWLLHPIPISGAGRNLLERDISQSPLLTLTISIPSYNIMQWMNNTYSYSSTYQTKGYNYLPGCSLAIVCARAGLLPPTLSSTALTRLFQVGFPNLSTWKMEIEQQTAVIIYIVTN